MGVMVVVGPRGLLAMNVMFATDCGTGVVYISESVWVRQRPFLFIALSTITVIRPGPRRVLVSGVSFVRGTVKIRHTEPSSVALF